MSKKRIKTIIGVSLQDRAQRYLQENNLLLGKFKMSLQLLVTFPQKKKAPLFSRMALWVVRKQGGQLDIEFKDLKI
jgi:hypothetical protein